MGSPTEMSHYPSSPVMFVHKDGYTTDHCQVSCEGMNATPSLMCVKLKAADAIGIMRTPCI